MKKRFPRTAGSEVDLGRGASWICLGGQLRPSGGEHADFGAQILKIRVRMETADVIRVKCMGFL